jgi:putative membrane protein
MKMSPPLGSAAVFLALAVNAATAYAQTPESKPVLGAVDTYFVTQTSLGTPFQTDAGRIAASKGTTEAIRSYAELMESSHIAVNDALQAVLKSKGPIPPPTLLKAAYATMIWSLQHEIGEPFDAEYVTGQIDYQHANVALYEYEIANGSDPDLKAFAQQTLPKIQDHLGRVLKLRSAARLTKNSPRRSP